MKEVFSCFLLYLFLVTPSRLMAQLSTDQILNDIIDHAEQNSLYRKNVDWSDLKERMWFLAKDAESVPELKPALDLMLSELKDSHGRVFHNNQYLSYYSGKKKPHRTTMNSETYQQIQSGQVFPFEASLLEDDIGYVRIVGLPMGDNIAMSSEIQEAVCHVMEEGAEKWIIDLRYNGGGNMFPMVEGIAALIGDGIVGGTQGASENVESVWQIRNGDFYYDEQTVALENKCRYENLPRLAVLTSVYTASSGEALAVILKQRPMTRFFGGKTMGMVTATDWKPLDDVTAMSISVSYYIDRDKNLYDKYVDVDEEIKFTAGSSLEEDMGVKRALEWLRHIGK